jgi:multisubunit Na+/H+ antiporter MnhB subunit
VIRRLITLDETVPLLFRVIMVGSIYLLFAGHNQPGGGFVGGLVAGAAISLRYIAGGIEEVRRISRWRPWTILGTGVIVSVSTALVPVLLGKPVLAAAYEPYDVPVLGKVSISSALVFDIGVYLVVVGLVLMVFEAFGDRFAAER